MRKLKYKKQGPARDEATLGQSGLGGGRRERSSGSDTEESLAALVGARRVVTGADDSTPNGHSAVHLSIRENMHVEDIDRMLLSIAPTNDYDCAVDTTLHLFGVEDVEVLEFGHRRVPPLILFEAYHTCLIKSSPTLRFNSLETPSVYYGEYVIHKESIFTKGS